VNLWLRTPAERRREGERSVYARVGSGRDSLIAGVALGLILEEKIRG